MKRLLIAAALLGLAVAAHAQSGSILNPAGGLRPPSTGTTADTAGTAGTTAPRTIPTAPETSVGTSGATPGNIVTGRSSGLCDTLTGDERDRCLREQAATGTQGGSAGAGGSGMGFGAGGRPGAGAR